MGHARALGHDRARARRRRHTGGDWQRDCHQDPLGRHRAALGRRCHHRARLVSCFVLVVGVKVAFFNYYFPLFIELKRS